MQQVVERLEAIELKIKEIGDHYVALKQENNNLKQKNITLINDLDQLKKDRQGLEFQLSKALTEVQDSQGGSEDRIRVKKELGQYIKEIDKCILMMGNI